MGHKHKRKHRQRGPATTIWKSAKDSASTFMRELAGRGLEPDAADLEGYTAVNAWEGKPVPKWEQYGHCHVGPVLIGQKGDMRLWAASKSELAGYKWALVICTAEEHIPAPIIAVSPAADKLLGGSFKPHERLPHISFDWRDGGVPWDVSKQDWESLAAAISGLAGDVVVHCQGGHGRTGTACAILATLLGWVPDAADPVAWLRAKYCQEAVETNGQLNYIAAITGRTVDAKPSEKWYYETVKPAVKNVGNLPAVKATTAVTATDIAKAISVPTIGKPAAVKATKLEDEPKGDLSQDFWTYVDDTHYRVYRNGAEYIATTNEAGDIIALELDRKASDAADAEDGK